MEATESNPARPQGNWLSSFLDRWIYVITAMLLVAVVLIGFVPDSFAKLAAIEAGERPPFSVYSHVHALTMGAWMLLLLTQATLMATGRNKYHFQLGMVALLLAPAILITGILLVPYRHELHWEIWANAAPEGKAHAEAAIYRLNNIALTQIRSGMLFALFVSLALYFRRSDPGLHKRMLILATLAPMGAAISRIRYLPSTLPESPLSNDLYILILLAPLFVRDWLRDGKIHRGYKIALCAWLPISAFLYAALDTQWWHEFVPRLMGVDTR